MTFLASQGGVTINGSPPADVWVLFVIHVIALKVCMDVTKLLTFKLGTFVNVIELLQHQTNKSRVALP